MATPVFYTLFDDAAAWLRDLFGSNQTLDRGEAEIGVGSGATWD